MASEAEYERLYQEFVLRNGGTYTFDGASMTPAEYYNLTSESELTPEQVAQLEAAQEQFNRQQALNTIAAELAAASSGSGATAFTNPYISVSTVGIANYTTLQSDPGYIALSDATTNLQSLGRLDVLHPTVSTDGSFTPSEHGAYYLLEQPDPTIAMYNQLRTHTDAQIADLPKIMQDATNLANMNKQFSEQGAGNSCDLFNQILGILAGKFNISFDFLNDITKVIKDLLAPITDVLNQLASAVAGAIDAILAPVKAMFDKIMATIGNIAGQIAGLVKGITDQILGELSGLLNLANDLLAKAQALIMAASAFDPCQLAVLLATGNSNITGALNTLLTPLSSPRPAVPTSTDSRADPSTVLSTVAAASRAAFAAPGVPQSPMTAAAKLYQPMSAYLHAAAAEVSGFLNNALGDLQSNLNIGNIIGGALSGVTGSSTSTSGKSSVVTNAKVESASYRDFEIVFLNDLLSSRNKLKTLRLEMSSGINNVREENYRDVQVLMESLQNEETTITNQLSYARENLIYTAPSNANKDETKESKCKETYNARIKPNATATVARSAQLLSNTTATWNGLKGV